MDFPVNLDIPELRPTDNSLRGVHDELVQNMSGSIDEGPMDIEQEIEFTTLRVQNVVLAASPSTDRVQLLQDKPGVIALLDDAYGISPVVILPEGLVSVDWKMGKNFLCILGGNRQSSFYMTHSEAGMERNLLIANNGTNQLVGAWDAAIHWPAAAAPTMPASPAGGSAMILVKLRNVGGTIYGESSSFIAPGSISGHRTPIPVTS